MCDGKRRVEQHCPVKPHCTQPFGEKNAISAAVTRDGRILEMLRRGNLVLCLYLFLLRKYLSILYERKGDNSVPVLFTAPTSQSNT